MWGDLGESLDQSLYKKDDGPFIFIVTSTLIKSFQGKLNFSTTSASKFYVNLPIPKVSTLLEKFSINNSGVHSIESSSFKKMPIEKEMFLNRMSIKDLLLIVSTGKQSEPMVTIKARITEINTSKNWYYISCSACCKLVEAENNVYFCKKCNKVCKYPLIRFKVHVKVEDASAKTTFVIFNSAGEKYLDTSAHKLFNRQSPGSNDFPSQLYNLCNKELIFKLTLNKKNTDEGFEDFGVSKIFELDEKLEMERKGKGVLINSATEQQIEIEEDSMSEKELEDNVKENQGLKMYTRKRRNKVVDDDEIIEVGGIEKGQGIWETYKTLSEDKSSHLQFKHEESVCLNTTSGIFSSDFSSTNLQETETDSMLPHTHLIRDWMPLSVYKDIHLAARVLANTLRMSKAHTD
ncbi:hypothetical protein ACFE04_016887 [Oxalis oulophora]